MKRIYLGLVMTLFFTGINAQTVNLEWAKSIGANAYEHSSALTTDAAGNVYTTGYYSFTVDFDPGPTTYQLTSVTAGMANAFIQKLDANGDFVWAKSLGGTSETYGNSIAVDALGNVYMAGYYNFTTDFDPGPGVHNLSTNGGTDFFVLKLDAGGNFVWAQSIGGGNMEEDRSMTVDASGNVYITGFFANVVDFDPGLATFNLTATSAEDMFILKLDNSGNFAWAKSIGGASSQDIGNAIAIDVAGNLITTGYFSGTVDFDPGSSTFNLSASGGTDAFIQKLDAAGNFIWAKSVGGSAADKGQSVALDALGNIYLTGSFEGTADFDPSATSFNLTANGLKDFFVLKLDGSGNFIWANATGGTADDESRSVAVDGSGDAYITGKYSGTVDFDPAPTTSNLTAATNGQIFIQKLDDNGDFVWAAGIGGTGNDASTFITVDALQNILLTGIFDGTADFDPTASTFNLTSNGSNDFFIQKLSQYTCATLPLVIDSVLSITCGSADSGYIHTQAQHGTPPYNYSWNTTPPYLDSVGTFASPGIYTVTATDVNNCARSATVLLNGPSSKVGFDLNANLTASSFRTGFPATVLMDAFNARCAGTSGQLMLVLDGLVQYDSASVVPDQIMSDTLVWNFNNLDYESAPVQPRVFLTTKTTAAIGDVICLQSIVTPISGDANTTNNSKQYCFDVVNAYDPNDKQVYPQGSCLENYVVKNEPLTYTVRFQNTGNSEAINIYVIDTISTHLDITTANIVGASHPMHTEVLAGNVLKFIFNAIYLPDSTSNEAKSHGYVTFEISPKGSLLDGTVIENTSGIYFDLNPVVMTNVVSNTLIDVIPFSTGTATITNCGAYTWIDGKTYTTSNNMATYRITGGANNLCDSIVTLDLTIHTIDAAVSTKGSTISANATGASYQWLDCNDNFTPISGETNQDFTASVNGDYAVEVTQNGCADTSTCITISTIGVTENTLFNRVSVYPNPNQGKVYVDLGSLKEVTVKVVDIKGQLVYRKEKINSSIHQFEFDEASGVYFLEVSAQGKQQRYKLVKE